MRNKSPFLALTSDRRFWDTSGEVVFLGEWCLDETTNVSELSFPYTIISSPWNRSRDIDRIGAYLEEFSEKLLAHLSRELSKLHGIDFGLREWRIIAGDCVFHAVHTLFDRFLLLDEAVRLHGKLKTRVPLPREADVPKTINNFKMAQLYPDTSLVLLGRLAGAMGIDCEYVKSPLIDQAKSIYEENAPWRLKEKAKDFVRTWLTIGKSIIFCDSGIRAETVKEMKINGTGVTVTEQWRPARYNPIDMGLRTKLFEKLNTDDRFQRIAVNLLPYFFPASLLEDYLLWNSKAKSFLWRSKAKVLVTAYGFRGSELFSIRAATLLKNGCNLVGMQHGGAYGIFRYCPEELHETKCSDVYATWGWRSDDNHLPLPSLHLMELLEKKRSLETAPNGILLVTTGRPHMTHRVMSHPLSGQISRYYLWQERFYEQLSSHLKSEFYLKLTELDHILSTPPWLAGRYTRIVEGVLTAMLNNFRLFVFDSNGTGFLESLACNIPTIVFWDPELWELKDSAIPYFEKLSSAGIFHTTPESAAMQINNVFEAVDEWWGSDLVQKARKEFCDNYARVNDGWKREWTNFLCRMAYEK